MRSSSSSTSVTLANPPPRAAARRPFLWPPPVRHIGTEKFAKDPSVEYASSSAPPARREGMLFQHFRHWSTAATTAARNYCSPGCGEATLRAIISDGYLLIMCHCSSSDIMLRVWGSRSCWGSYTVTMRPLFFEA